MERERMGEKGSVNGKFFIGVAGGPQIYAVLAAQMMGGLHCVCVCRKVKTDTISAEIGPWRFAHVMFVVAPYAKQKVSLQPNS
eukprot:71396-Pelagomonas_calceolata.AAC.1